MNVFAVVVLLVAPFSFAAAAEDLRVVENEKVCMVTDMLFGKKQIPVTHAGKTYFGCCQNCKKTLSEDAAARNAIDPVTGKTVDKATAVIAARADNSVLYFENRKSFEAYAKKSVGAAKPSTSDHSGH